ncbi:MAG TPA: S-adenosylmethionine:tRNA ribosyltransferase-isomerase [Thermoanaerobaculia bacterium]|nr:S-adenosylmethionine:tRNA ribosyltransferase-isomerase [Thermoanaerobaculia bacterium]
MSALEFTLPPRLEARVPAELRGAGRDDVRLMVSDLATGAVHHAHFRELPAFLRKGDLLVLNTSATLPAALTATRASGEEIALHWSTPLPAGLSVVEPRPLTPALSPRGGERVLEERVRGGETLRIPNGTLELLAPYRDSKRLWIARFDIGMPIIDYLHRFGRPIAYSYVSDRFPISAYQTVYARSEGSAEMPSAGRAFTQPLLACLRKSGVGLARLVLHTGVASLEEHEPPYDEWYEVPLRTAERIRRTKADGGRVIAVGTTVVRALESSVDGSGNVIASKGWTDLVITPERGVRVVDGLLTGLHEPKATHLQMLTAIAGDLPIRRAYGEALARDYLWHEFGDLHLIA